MKAIPSTYGGVEFRSRLEARTAMLLDQYDMEWHYEAEGFELSDGTRYLPDFWLPKIRTYIEVKGQNVPGVDKAQRFAHEVIGVDPDKVKSLIDWSYDDGPVPDGYSEAWQHPPTLVLIATLDRRNHYDRLRLINALGASVFGTRCPQCSSLQWVNIGAWRCRVCEFNLYDHVHLEMVGTKDESFSAAPELPRLAQWKPGVT